MKVHDAVMRGLHAYYSHPPFFKEHVPSITPERVVVIISEETTVSLRIREKAGVVIMTPLKILYKTRQHMDWITLVLLDSLAGIASLRVLYPKGLWKQKDGGLFEYTSRKLR